MELFLNILWTLIALGALAIWRLAWHRQERHSRPKPLQEWTAFVCALVFVFFAVSLSDDLRTAEILADDCASWRHHSLVWHCGHHAHQTAICAHVPHAAVLSRAVFSAPDSVFSPIISVLTARVITRELHLATTRAPPVLPS